MRDYPPHTADSGTMCVGAGTNTLMRQAQMTAHDYMHSAKNDAGELFGAGFAIRHPELVAAYMQTAAMDFGAAVIARAIEGLDRGYRTDGE